MRGELWLATPVETATEQKMFVSLELQLYARRLRAGGSQWAGKKAESRHDFEHSPLTAIGQDRRPACPPCTSEWLLKARLLPLRFGAMTGYSSRNLPFVLPSVGHALTARAPRRSLPQPYAGRPA